MTGQYISGSLRLIGRMADLNNRRLPVRVRHRMCRIIWRSISLARPEKGGMQPSAHAVIQNKQSTKTSEVGGFRFISKVKSQNAVGHVCSPLSQNKHPLPLSTQASIAAWRWSRAVTLTPQITLLTPLILEGAR